MKTSRASRPVDRRRIRAIDKALRLAYGSPHHANKTDPLDELIFILLSQMTTSPSFCRVYDRLKRTYPTWDALAALPLARLKALIRDAGLTGQKAPRIKTILRTLAATYGRATLNPLRTMADAEAEAFLTSLPGVGTKTAKCVLMYSLGRQVLPVDTHVWRVARRLGLVDAKVPYAKVHEALEAAVPPRLRYTLHVNALAHGRKVCLAVRPRCGACPLRRSCPSRQ
jgi:endonuclease III